MYVDLKDLYLNRINNFITHWKFQNLFLFPNAILSQFTGLITDSFLIPIHNRKLNLTKIN